MPAMSPVLGNPEFPVGISDPIFKKWAQAGYFRSAHFAPIRSFCDVGNFGVERNLPSLGFWRELQLFHYLSSLPLARLRGTAVTPFERLCAQSGRLSHTISMIYPMLCVPPDTPPPQFLSRWESELGRSFDDKQKQMILYCAHKTSIASKVQETNYKILTRWYQVPLRLSRIFPDSSSACWRCESDHGSMTHIFWSCPELRSFWEKVSEITGRVTGTVIPDDPAALLLNLFEVSKTKYRKSLIPQLLNASKACIPAMWRQRSPPTVNMWMSRVGEITRMEELSALTRGQAEKHNLLWRPWYQFLYASVSPIRTD